VNLVRNSNGPSPRKRWRSGLNPALRGGTPYGAEPGIILKPNPAAAAGPEGATGHYFLRGERIDPFGIFSVWALSA